MHRRKKLHTLKLNENSFAAATGGLPISANPTDASADNGSNKRNGSFHSEQELGSSLAFFVK